MAKADPTLIDPADLGTSAGAPVAGHPWSPVFPPHRYRRDPPSTKKMID
jgi:hypothetical protein